MTTSEKTSSPQNPVTDENEPVPATVIVDKSAREIRAAPSDKPVFITLDEIRGYLREFGHDV